MEIASRAVGDYLKRKSTTDTLNLDQCLDEELNAIKKEFKKKNKISVGMPMKRDYLNYIIEAYIRMEPTLSEMTKKRFMTRKRSEKARAIGVSTTRAILDVLLKDSGLDYDVHYQKYRAKFIVRLDRGSFATLYIHYKDVVGKKYDGFIPALKTLNYLVARK